MLVAGLSAGTLHYFRAYATNNSGTAYGGPRVSALPSNITVVSTSPTANELNVSNGWTVIVNFSSAINGTTVNYDTFNVDGSLTGRIAGTYGTVGSVVTFTPSPY